MITTTSIIDPPDLEGFAVHYGVRVTFIGDDGSPALMLGHIEPRRALAALNRCVRKDLGWSLANEGLTFDADDFEHRWACLVTRCEDYPDCPRKAMYFGMEVCVHCQEIQGADWWLDFDVENTVDTQGAFPVTIVEM